MVGLFEYLGDIAQIFVKNIFSEAVVPAGGLLWLRPVGYWWVTGEGGGRETGRRPPSRDSTTPPSSSTSYFGGWRICLLVLYLYLYQDRPYVRYRGIPSRDSTTPFFHLLFWGVELNEHTLYLLLVLYLYLYQAPILGTSVSQARTQPPSSPEYPPRILGSILYLLSLLSVLK